MMRRTSLLLFLLLTVAAAAVAQPVITGVRALGPTFEPGALAIVDGVNGGIVGSQGWPYSLVLGGISVVITQGSLELGQQIVSVSEEGIVFRLHPLFGPGPATVRTTNPKGTSNAFGIVIGGPTAYGYTILDSDMDGAGPALALSSGTGFEPVTPLAPASGDIGVIYFTPPDEAVFTSALQAASDVSPVLAGIAAQSLVLPTGVRFLVDNKAVQVLGIFLMAPKIYALFFRIPPTIGCALLMYFTLADAIVSNTVTMANGNLGALGCRRYFDSQSYSFLARLLFFGKFIFYVDRVHIGAGLGLAVGVDAFAPYAIQKIINNPVLEMGCWQRKTIGSPPPPIFGEHYGWPRHTIRSWSLNNRAGQIFVAEDGSTNPFIQFQDVSDPLLRAGDFNARFQTPAMTYNFTVPSPGVPDAEWTNRTSVMTGNLFPTGRDIRFQFSSIVNRAMLASIIFNILTSNSRYEVMCYLPLENDNSVTVPAAMTVDQQGNPLTGTGELQALLQTRSVELTVIQGVQADSVLQKGAILQTGGTTSAMAAGVIARTGTVVPQVTFRPAN